MYKQTDFVEVLDSKKSKYRKYCEHCGHTLSFFAFEGDIKLCNYCHRYNYRNEKIKFRYLLRRKINKLI